MDLSSPKINSQSDEDDAEEKSTVPNILNVVKMSCLKFSGELIQHIFSISITSYLGEGYEWRKSRRREFSVFPVHYQQI